MMAHLERSSQKSCSVMQIFHKGSDTFPPDFRKLWNWWYTFDLGNKKGEKQNLPKAHKKGHI